MSTETNTGTMLSENGVGTDGAVVESLVNAPTVGLVVVDPDGIVHCIDEAAQRYFDTVEEQAVDTGRECFVESSIRAALKEPDQFPDQEGGVENSVDLHVLPAAEREERWLRYSRTPITTGQLAGGQLEQFVDVTAEYTRERLEQYRSIAETTDDAVFVVDSNYTVEYANPAAETRTDRSVSALTGKSILSPFEDLLVGDSNVAELRTSLEQVFEGTAEESTVVELQLATPTGSKTYCFDCTPVDGTRKAIVSVRDVSAKRRRERRYETLVENFPNGAVTLVDEQLEYQLAGGKLFDELAQTPADVEGWKVGDIESGDRDVFVESYQAALNGETTSVETSIDDMTLLLRTLPVADEDGTVRAAIGMTQDITERKERAEELRWKSRALDEAPVGVAITDPEQDDNPMIYVNREFSDLSGYDSDAVLGRNCRFLQGEETDPETVARIRQAIDDQRPVSVELRNYRADGTEFWNELHIAPVRDETDTVVNFVGFQQEITERKEQERKLRDVNQLLDIALTETDTGIWILGQDDDTVRAFGTTTELFDFEPGAHSLERYLALIHPADRPLVEDALETAREREERFDIEFRVQTDETERWVHSRGAVSADDGGDLRMVGVVTDITARKRRIDALEKRERILNELHTATREFYPPGTLDEIAEFLVEFTQNAFDVYCTSVKQYDEETGALVPTVQSGPSSDNDCTIGIVSPGSNPIWEAYRTGETRLFADAVVEDLLTGIDVDATQLLVAPVGDFGVMTAVTTAEDGFDAVDISLTDVLTENAESAFQRLRSDKVHTAITAELSDQQSRVDELRGFIDSVQAVQRRLADSDSQDALETGVCEELVAMDQVDFVWIGRPTSEDTDLSPAAWAGDAEGYLDSVLTDRSDQSLPAQRAADDHQTYSLGSIAGHVFDGSWAKDALYYELSSVTSIPLVYDGVLYGVLTLYSRSEDAFTEIYEDLFADVGSLLVNYSRILDQQQVGSQRIHTELEFKLTDSTYPLQRLATEAESAIRLDTVAERSADHVRILVTVVEGDATTVLDRAVSMTSIDAADWFGDAEHSQLSLLVRKPFFASVVSKHSGQLRESRSEECGTTVRIDIPENVSERPLFDSLTSRYQNIDLVAKRQTHRRAIPDTQEITDILTDRQSEILNAAFHGGYYETPRRVKGEDLAASFDISGPAVYNHLQAAHRTLLETIFELQAENND